jgi:nicotinamidase-related amidase
MKPDPNTALIVIDAQEGIKEELHWGGNRNNPNAEQNIAGLLQQWRQFKWPVVIVQHCSISATSPLRSSHPGNQLMGFVNLQPHEKLIRKSTANAFINTDLEQYIKQEKISSLIITGFVTNNSVEATARMAGDLGFETIVVADATACFDKLAMDGIKYTSDVVHQLSLANLKDEYASIKTTEEILRSI